MVASALEQMGVACWEYDIAADELWWSENAGPMVGRAKGFIPGSLNDAFGITAPDASRPSQLDQIVRALEDGPIESDRQMVLPDGSTKWIRHRYFLGLDDDGAPGRLLGMMIDIDSEKKRQLEESALARAGPVLSSSLDVDETLRSVAGLLVPEVADWCVVHLAEDGEMRSGVIAHVDPEKVSWAEAMQDEYPTDPNAPSGVANVLRTGESEFYEDVTDEMLAAAARDERHLEILQEVGFRSVMVVPLKSRFEPIGTLTLVSADSRRRFDEQSLRFTERLARQLAMAIDNANLHADLQAAWEGQRQAVDTLQQGLSPDPLPNIEGLELVAHYEIGGTSKIGGDWYDASITRKGEAAFVVGDVAGKGVPGVAAMSRYRNALKVLAYEGDPPGSILSALNGFGLRQQPAGESMATAVCMLYDTATGLLRWARAGHVLPMLRRPDGEVMVLDAGSGPALGVDPEFQYPESVVEVPTGSLLLLYTDGLIERKGESIDVSMDRLASVLRSAPPAVEEIPGFLMERLPSNPLEDDVAILAVSFGS